MTGMTYGSLIQTMPSGEGVMTNATIERSYNRTEIPHGTLIKQFFASTEVTMGFEMEICASGIVPALTGSQNIASVQASYEEKTSPVTLRPVDPGNDMSDTARLTKVADSCFNIFGLITTINVSGKGEPVWEAAQQGTTPSVTFTSAYGTFSIAVPATAKIEGVGKGSTNDGEPDTWNGTIYDYTANAGTITEHIIDVSSVIEALIPANHIYTVTESYTMDADQATQVKHTVNLTAYPTT